MIRVYNTLTRKKEEFIPIHKGKVGFYSCGPTVYWFQHIGNMRTYVFNDLLKRMFMYNGLKVTHVMNYTDVGHLTSDSDEGDDKMEKAASREKKSASEIALFYTKAFEEDAAKLNIISPDETPTATGHIPEQIAMIETLEKKGFTYKTEDGVYFDTSKLEDYGKLDPGHKKELDEGHRISKGDKRNATDFALWKFSEEKGKRQQEWDSPWGLGFPGWHIECSCMSSKYLGKQFDVHTGGEDHIEIHHTDEIAQSEAAYGEIPWVTYWMHAAWLTSKGEKISKSSGGLFTVSELAKKGYDPLAFRYLCLNTVYRKQLNFDLSVLDQAQQSYDRLKRIILDLKQKDDSDKTKDYDMYKNKFLEAVNDDLNVTKGLSVLWDVLKDKRLGSVEKLELAYDFDKVLGLGLSDLKENTVEIDSVIQKLLDKRAKARREKDFKASDKIRDELLTKGFVVKDTKDGQKLEKA